MDTAAMKGNIDKLKQKAASAKESIVTNLKSMNIKPCSGEDFEYASNDEDYNEFLKNEGIEEDSCAKIPVYRAEEEPNEEDKIVPKAEKGKKIDNISEAIAGQINKFKRAMDETAEKKTAMREELVNIQETVNAVDDEIKKLFEQFSYVSGEIEGLKAGNDALAKETRSASASSAFTLEKTMSDIADLNNKLNVVSENVLGIGVKLTTDAAERDSVKNEIMGLKNTVNKINSDMTEIADSQQELKNTLMSLNAVVDSLNRKLSTGFVTVGIISAICALMVIVFNVF